MQFHLNHKPSKSNFLIGHESRIMLTGSCFAENIGKNFHDLKFKSICNPSGILFNPLSIATSLSDIINQQPINEKYILNRGELFFSYQHHSSVFGNTKTELIDKIKIINEEAYQFLIKTEVLIITFGSAFVYEHFELGSVGNCHKQAGTLFTKKLLTVSEIVKEFVMLINEIKSINPSIKIIFTVSPVKYLRDGVVENNLSKSTLLLSVNELVNTTTNCFYFPAFELVNDDLRDYRFYKPDMAHPNEQAIEYVWNKFSDCFFDEKTKELNKLIHKLNLALLHRPMNNSFEATTKLDAFIEKQKLEIKNLKPFIEF